ncbi:GNAT family N-acetyltransferase [Gordonia sp. CPCC 206044]|uniref:N-acetylglutamate synthase, CG3035 family n=1 Tax=Gordonia sp. CPCC 206044 TaxID=3140793 RepID=UPI003AF344B9
MTDPFPGDRVVVRYRLADDAPTDWRATANPATRGPSLSDITGKLRDDGDPLRIERDGTVEAVPRSAVTSIRVLSNTAVRNSAIRDLERAAALAWPGTDSEWIDGWFARAGGGFTRRANSAIPVEFGARADVTTLAAIRTWYRDRDLPATLALPDRLLRAGIVDARPVSGEIQILARDVTGLDTTEHSSVHLADSPTPEWLRAYRGPEIDVHTAAGVVGASRGPVAVASVGAEPRAIGRASVTSADDGTRWLGLTALWTDPTSRRGGLAGSVVSTLVGWGVAHGAERVYVQVEADNRIAGTWYRALGFGLHHTSRYVEI